MIRRAIVKNRVLLAVLVSVCLAVLITGAGAAAEAGDKGSSSGGALTKETWQQDVRIKAIEAMVQGVNAGMGSGAIATAKRVFEYCQPYGIVERVIAKDTSGRVWMYEERGGSDNSDRRIKRYYAEKGQLRFVLVTDNVRGGGELVQRVYFDEAGKRLWVDNKVTGAPENAVPSNYPDDILVIENPGKAFTAPSPCKEITP
jgi:hypothetical protein